MNIITISVVILLVILLLTYTIRNSVSEVMSYGIHAFVILFTVITLSGLFLSGLYTYLAYQTLDVLGITTSIEKLDDSFVLDDFAAESTDVIDDISNWFSGSDSGNETQTPSKTIFKDTIYNPLVSAISLLYRTLAVVISLSGLIAMLYVSYATAGLTEVHKLRKRVENLEEQLKT